MTLESQKKLAQHIFRLLKVNEIVFPIGRTNNGNLGLKFSQNNDDFEIMLDAVPLSTKDILKDDNNIELKQLLEKYLFEVPALTLSRTKEDKVVVVPVSEIIVTEGLEVSEGEPLKKRGRPKGSKNKEK